MSKLRVYAGRDKKFPMTWRSGNSPSSPVIDATGATCKVHRTTLKSNPTIAGVNPALGQFELFFPGSLTSGIVPGTTHTVTISLTFSSNPGNSPDPVTVEVLFL